jgi:hypothetical protein
MVVSKGDTKRDRRASASRRDWPFGRVLARRRAFLGALLSLWLVSIALPAMAFRVIGAQDRWLRWDAAPRSIGGEERSLAGGLRYSVETGSYDGLANQLGWLGTPPTGEQLRLAIQRAFEHWTVVDPATGLPAAFHFVEDLDTLPVDAPGLPGNSASFLGVNPGAEIDIFAETPHAGPSFAASVVFFIDPVADDLTLSSGRPGYAGFAIAGADIRINPAFVWPLSGFEALLTHEIGHALGLADLEAPAIAGSTSGFLDDDYDPSSSASAAATLTNSFALLIDPFDPDASALRSFSGVMNTDPGLDTPNVSLLMESEDYLSLRNLDPVLQNDDFAARQFLYPVVVPEPGFGGALALGAACLGLASRRRPAQGKGLRGRQ